MRRLFCRLLLDLARRAALFARQSLLLVMLLGDLGLLLVDHKRLVLLMTGAVLVVCRVA